MPGIDPLRVLAVTVRADLGGGPEHLFQLTRAFGPHVITTIACPEEPPYHARYQALDNVERVIDLPHRAFSLARLRALAGLVRDSRIDLIHSHGKGAGLYTRLLSAMTGRPCVHTFHGLHVGEYDPVKRSLYLMLERALGLATDAAICVSEGERDLIAAARILPKRKLNVVENGVVVPDLVVGQDDALRIVAVNRFDHQKNPELLVEIADALRVRLGDGFFMTVIGQGDALDATRRAIADRGLSDHVLLPGPTNDPRAVFRAHNVFLSTSRWEGMPLAVLEAMSEGLAVVATDVVGNRDVVRDGVTGALYPLDDSGRAADILAALQPTARRAMGGAGRQAVLTQYSVGTMADRTRAVYDACLRTGGSVSTGRSE